MPSKRSSKSSSQSKPTWKDDTISWNKNWERENDALFGSDLIFTMNRNRPTIKLLDSLPAGMLGAAMSDSLLQNVHVMQNQLCTLQRDLSRKVSKRYAEDDFVHQWTEVCTAQEREKWMMEGLARTCDASPDFEAHRRFCPEITMRRLNIRSGKGFLELMEKLTLQDIDTVPDDFRKVPNPVWEAMNDSLNDPGKEIYARLMDMQRSSFLTFFVWNTLLAFYGEQEEYGLMKPPGGRAPPQQLKETAQKDQEFGRALKNAYKEVKANSAEAQRGCVTCGLTAERAGVRALLACQKCKSIGRTVFYCNRECQVKDWKLGRPPHKTICGNTEALADAILGTGEGTPSQSGKGNRKLNASEDEDGSLWKDPKPGYTRSPALLHQMKLLEENPNLDYVLVRPEPHPDQGVMFPDPMGKLFFKVLLNWSVSEFSPQMVCRMYDMLLPMAERSPGIGKAGLKRQLMREYNVDIDKWGPIAQRMADDKLKEERKAREQPQKKTDEDYEELMKRIKKM
ncbi:hypothetical protein GYMLUDRAFT_40452 [Collybiopsis luxurians FD-317 M1]|uniref:MYND-type domain-containing protein n=1 Tax=Collybiopsis luxurians FD-317 M1 TaxID=944289 RepID=A0A0D0C7K1_9AGAR|nr:hypothetical protein GYMLUDRAFT_40452 [Collybiopsis luxurians FD-317 M1]